MNAPTPETDGMTFFAQPGMMPPYNTVSSEFARERDAALAANAELLERLRERTDSHLAASARDVQTIQQQAVMMERLAKLLSRLKTKDWFTSGDTGEVIVALDAGEVRSALKAYELLKGKQP
jgi:hypothetical protein